MRLTQKEFNAMNNPLRRFFQRRIEYPVFRRMGLNQYGKDILEIGCGNGYGAVLLSALKPASYTGIDLMPEQIELAQKRDLPGYRFMVMDASDLSYFSDASKDIIVIFGILHHIPAWKQVLGECRRVLRPGGSIFLEEPDASLLRWWDRVFKWDHFIGENFSLRAVKEFLVKSDFEIRNRISGPGFGSYHAVLKKDGAR